jgi:hypothetical protein
MTTQSRPSAGWLEVIFCPAAAAAMATGSTMFVSEPGSAGSFTMLVTIGFVYIVFSGLPGFATAVFVARCFRIRHWAFFTVADGLNAMLAWLLVGGFEVVFAIFDDGLMLASLAGSLVGGFVYWLAAEHSARSRAIASD